MIICLTFYIQERLRINVNLPDTPEPGPVVNQDNGVTIQKKPKVSKSKIDFIMSIIE